jgi:hypothetical protein
VVDDGGLTLGQLVWDPAGKQLDAHCGTAAHNAGHSRCHTDRALTTGRRKGQGRPIGFLVAWLRCCGCPSKSDHQQLKTDLGKLNKIHERRSARAWLHGRPGAAQVFGLERAVEAGENSEPDVIG